MLLCSLLLSRGSMSAAKEVDKSVDESGTEVPEVLRNGGQHAGNYTRRRSLLGLELLGLGRLDVRAGTLKFVLGVFSSALETTLVSEAARSDAEGVRVLVVVN